MNILQITSNMKKNGPALVVYDLSHGLAECGNKVYIASGEGELADQLTNSNIQYVHIPIERVAGNRFKQILRYIPNSIKAYAILKRCIKENHIDIINSHQPIPNLYAKKLSKVLRVPFVTTSHNVYSDGFLNRTYVSGNHIVAVSDKVLRNSIENFGIDSNKITCICNGINPKRLQPDKSETYEGKFVVGTIAGLRKQKALDNMIKAFALFHKEVENSVLVIGGDGGERNYLKKLVEELNLQDSVKFLGFRSDVANVISSFDIFALSSEYEGLPISMLEAMAMKKPVIVTAVGGIPEVIIDRENGMLIRYNDIERMSREFMNLYANPELSNKLGNNGYKTVRIIFGYHKMAASYMKVYKQLLENNYYE